MGMLELQRYLNRNIKLNHYSSTHGKKKKKTLFSEQNFLTISSCQKEHISRHVPSNLIDLEKKETAQEEFDVGAN